MDNERIRDIRDRIKKLFTLECVHSILVFGSLAKGDFTERSDIDICVVAPDVKDKEAFANKIAA